MKGCAAQSEKLVQDQRADYLQTHYIPKYGHCFAELMFFSAGVSETRLVKPFQNRELAHTTISINYGFCSIANTSESNCSRVSRYIEDRMKH